MAKDPKKTGSKSTSSYDDDVEDEGSADEVGKVTPDDDEELKGGEPSPPAGSPPPSVNVTPDGQVIKAGG
jgi:hypothetical protein